MTRTDEHQAKVERFMEDLKARGRNPKVATPPIWRLLWRLGLRLPPPQFMSWLGLFVTIACFGFLGGLAGIFIGTRSALSRLGLPLILLMASVGAVVVGLVLASGIRARARTLDLPSWEDYDREDLF